MASSKLAFVKTNTFSSSSILVSDTTNWLINKVVARINKHFIFLIGKIFKSKVKNLNLKKNKIVIFF
jgi:hypothetical protein